jgi:hypothetical protein
MKLLSILGLSILTGCASFNTKSNFNNNNSNTFFNQNTIENIIEDSVQDNVPLIGENDEIVSMQELLYYQALERVLESYKLPSELISFYFSSCHSSKDNSMGMFGSFYFNLGNDSEKNSEFIDLFGEQLYLDNLGKNILVINDFNSFKARYLSERPGMDLLDSIYFSSSDMDLFYQRLILHELGHFYFNELYDTEIVNRFAELDIRGRVWEYGSEYNHPGHASFYSFFNLTTDLDPVENRFNSANETFAEIFSLYFMGSFDKDVDDPILSEKIEIMKHMLSKYRIKENDIFNLDDSISQTKEQRYHFQP